ncbi:hypothetical protein ACE6H2_010431 [Prunus campanulata]
MNLPKINPIDNSRFDSYPDSDLGFVEHFPMFCLNAFDLISFSTGLDLSRLFNNHSYGSAEDGERFVLEETVEKVVERAEAFAKADKLRVRRKKAWGLEMEEQNGNLAIGVEVYRLTENLVVVVYRSFYATSLSCWEGKSIP